MSVTLWITQKLRKQSSSIWKLSDSTKQLFSWLMKKWFSTMCLCHFSFFLLINVKKKSQPTFILRLYWFIGCNHTLVAIMKVWQKSTKTFCDNNLTIYSSQKIWKTQQWPQTWKMLVFIQIPKKVNAKECSNYPTIALISHASNVMLKILQARFQ